LHSTVSLKLDLPKSSTVEDKLKNIVKKYEGNLVCLPANPAYFIDRINNGNYR